MKIVIDIDENVYKKLMDKTICVVDIFNAIKNGTPLPKGHGDLIDRNSVYQIVRPIEQSDVEWGVTAETAIQLIYDAFNKAPTIIEADTEVN
ncbi:MAG: hypothetical protein J6T10_29450 [Methanobrevibacter sp.]|nr:hypothetical protein [Methanobrevibacter sp.]